VDIDSNDIFDEKKVSRKGAKARRRDSGDTATLLKFMEKEGNNLGLYGSVKK
jgi:hypothetical protein